LTANRKYLMLIAGNRSNLMSVSSKKLQINVSCW